jgi:hypothetical protein
VEFGFVSLITILIVLQLNDVVILSKMLNCLIIKLLKLLKNTIMKPVIIKAITLTRPTQVKTGLRENEFNLLLQQELTDFHRANYTFKVEFQQEAEAITTTTKSNFGRRMSQWSLSDKLSGHEKVNGNGPRYKRIWENAVNLKFIEENGWTVGADMNQIMGTQVYLLREDFREAAFGKDNKIVSAPKRSGKGGDVLLKDGMLLFQDTSLVTALMPEFEDYTYEDFVLLEQNSRIQHDSVIDSSLVPEETKQDGFFTGDFAEWLHEQYAAKNANLLMSVD